MVFHEEFVPFSAPSALAIGNFDGLHLGHRRILETLQQRAAKQGLQPIIMSFAPHPRIFLGHSFTPIRTQEQRLADLLAEPVAALYMIPFSRAMEIPADVFIQEYLVERLRMRTLVVGDDFRFGRQRAGNLATLEVLALRLSFDLEAVQPVALDGVRVSSSAIRHRIQAGDIEAANRLLGYRYRISGKVVHGLGRGRQLGIPTLNLETPNRLLPHGVFHTLVEWQGQFFPGATNIGHNPTFQNHTLTIETHIPGIDIDWYGQEISLHFMRKLRDERHFRDSQALLEQIQHDIAAIKDPGQRPGSPSGRI